MTKPEMTKPEKVSVAELYKQGKQEKKREFIEAYLKIRNVHKACESISLSPDTLYLWLNADADFAKQYQAVKWAKGQYLVGVAEQRAEEKSDLLLMFTIKGILPEYRDSFNVQHTDIKIYHEKGEEFRAHLERLMIEGNPPPQLTQGPEVESGPPIEDEGEM